MADQFVGRLVAAQLTDGSSLRGTVSHVENGELRLSDVFFPRTNSKLAVFTLSGSQIADINVLPSSATEIQSETRDEHVNDDDGQMSNETPIKSRKKKSKQRYEDEGWESDLQNIKNHEFDFQANLNMFDKATVFEEIKKNDTIDPSQRLHTFNKNGKYGNTEMVITQSESSPETVHSKKPQNSNGNGPSTATPIPRGRRYVQVNGQNVPLITPLQRVELDTLMKQHAETQVENAGRGIAWVIMQALGGSTRFTASNHNAPPVVVILGGGKLSKTANQRAVSASRFLINRGVVIKSWKQGAPDGSISGPVDLIVDAICGIETDPDEDIDPSIQKLTDWANTVQNRRTPIVAIDVPCPWITRPPKLIVSSGLPSTAIPNVYTSSKTSTSHYIVDINIPRNVLADRFARFQSLYFGADFVVLAHPVETD